MSFFGLKSHNQRGQATIEVILLALVAVIVILGLIYRFNSAFRQYTIDLYGTYYRCLLETGELPGTQSVCRDRDARFSIANGTALVQDGSSDANGNGGGSSSGDRSAGSGESGSSSGNRSDAGGSGSAASRGRSGGDNGGEAVGGGQSGGGRGSTIARLSRAARARSTTVGSAADRAPEDAEAAARAGEGGLTIDATGARANASDPLRRDRTKIDYKMDGGEFQREETKASVPMTAAASSKKSSERGSVLRPRKVVENTDRKPAKVMEDQGGGLEFGRLFRMFLMFGIIAAIVVFLGGQVLQISKSSER